jgi:2-phosphosulfolactate phosphatase
MALDKGAKEIVIGAFSNLDVLCHYLIKKNKPVLLACAAWKDRVNIEDSLFAGAVVKKIREHFNINCDSSQIAESMYSDAEDNLFEFMKIKEANHFKRLSSFGLEKDIQFCLTSNTANVLPVYTDGKLIKKTGIN